MPGLLPLMLIGGGVILAAAFRISWKVNPRTGKVKMFHVKVRIRPKWDPVLKKVTGRTEDPSKRLGM